MSAIVYPYEGNLYINLTSRCPTACRFCIKFTWKGWFRGYDLIHRASEEPSAEEVIAELEKALGDPPKYREAVFCGYGESTYRLEEMREIGRWLKARGLRVRLNTIGLGGAIHGRPIGKDLAEVVDCVSVSLNTADPRQHEEIHNPLPEFRGRSFESAVEFIRDCVGKIPRVIVTCVEQPGVDVERCRVLASSLGAEFRVRPYLEASEKEFLLARS